MNYADYLKSAEWQGVRSHRLRIDGFRCVKCGSIRELHVHHINYDNIGHEDVEADLVTLCRRCHKNVEGVGNAKPVEVYRPKADDNLLSERERLLVQILHDSPALARRFYEDPALVNFIRPELHSHLEHFTKDEPRPPIGSSITVQQDRIDRAVDEAIAADREYHHNPEFSYRRAVYQIERDNRKKQFSLLHEQVKDAERAGDEPEVLRLLRIVDALVKENALHEKYRHSTVGE